ncbi:MAG: hypothetical protein PHG82_01650 [Candidatus Gracilibacteria bacterium]|nr:hypothetical protein [Candidatus Gracilibacteria bacterium]
MQNFSPEIHEIFKRKFEIKENPSQIDKEFLEKARKYLNFIKWIPGIKMIGVGNSISMNTGTSDSDIDLFIVTSPNKLWTVRILITIIFQILLVRKTSTKHAGRFCLSFFATENALDFGTFAIKNDVYLYFRILYFKPILDFDNTYEKFIEANATWANFSLYQDIIEENRKGIKIKNVNVGNEYFHSDNNRNENIRSLPEKILKNIFLPRTIKTYEKLRKPFGVIINDDMLKFHDKDVREEIRDEIISR